MHDDDSLTALLSTPALTAVLKRASTLAAEGLESPAIMLRLKKEFPASSADILALGLESGIIRQKLTHLAWAESALFTRQGFEQRSAPEIAAHHAGRFRGCRKLLEIGTGLGFDTAALAQVVPEVVTIEADPLTAALARHNLNVQGITNVTVVTGEAPSVFADLDLTTFDGLWSDPARRSADGQRISDPSAYRPPLAEVMNLPVNGVCGIKVSPGLNLPPSAAGWAREWIGFAKECREQVLWHGTDVADNSVQLVDTGQTWIPPINGAPAPVLTDAPAVGSWLIEPHAALIRTQALSSFFAQQKAVLIDPQIAYAVVSELPEPSPWFETFQIHEVFPYNIKRLKRFVQEKQCDSSLEIKKRGFPLTPDAVRSMLRLQPTRSGNPQQTIFLTRQGDDHIVIFGERIRRPSR